MSQSKDSARTGTRRLLIPKEFGAWGILLVPYAIGLAVAGQWNTRAFLLLGVMLFFFFARYPLVLWARTRFQKFPEGALPGFLFQLGHGTFLAMLLLFKFDLWQLPLLGGIALALLAGHLFLVGRRKERTTLGEFMGVCALTLTAPAALYAVTGQLSSTTWLLWLVNILYFGSGIFYVKMRLSPRRATLKGENAANPAIPLAAYHAAAYAVIALLSVLSLVPWFTFVAFLPQTVHFVAGAMTKTSKLNVRRMGWTLVGQSIVYGFVLTAVFRIGM